jgi:glycerate-2-kinase
MAQHWPRTLGDCAERPGVRTQEKLSFHFVEQIDKLAEFGALFSSIAGRDGFGDTAGGVVFQDFALRSGKRSFNCLHLMQNVDAITVIGDHLADAAHLPLYAPEPVENG